MAVLRRTHEADWVLISHDGRVVGALGAADIDWTIALGLFYFNSPHLVDEKDLADGLELGRRVAAGESLVITAQGRPIAVLLTLADADRAGITAELWDTPDLGDSTAPLTDSELAGARHRLVLPDPNWLHEELRRGPTD